MRNINDFSCRWGIEDVGALDEDFFDSPIYDIFFKEYQKWGGLGAPIDDGDDDDRCIDEDSDSEPQQDDPLPPARKPTPSVPAPNPNQRLPEPPNDGYEYEQHFNQRIKTTTDGKSEARNENSITQMIVR